MINRNLKHDIHNSMIVTPSIKKKKVYKNSNKYTLFKGAWNELILTRMDKYSDNKVNQCNICSAYDQNLKDPSPEKVEQSLNLSHRKNIAMALKEAPVGFDAASMKSDKYFNLSVKHCQ